MTWFIITAPLMLLGIAIATVPLIVSITREQGRLKRQLALAPSPTPTASSHPQARTASVAAADHGIAA